MRIRILLPLLILLALPRPAAAMEALAHGVVLRMHDPQAATVINQILTDPAYWQDARRDTYDDELYDELRLKEVEMGLVPMVAGEGDRDLPREVIEDVIFTGFEALPAHIDLAKRVVHLGQGYDPKVGADYVDTFFYLDLKLLYLTASWRVYRTRDAGERSILWFEKLPEETLPEAVRAAYQQRIQEASGSVDRRRGLFGSLNKPAELYGMFLIEDGRRHQSRVTFVARLVFGPEASWLTAYASQLPFVVRAALKGAFDASVGLCYAAAAEPHPAR